MTTIGKSIVIEGDVTAEEDLVIEGRVDGQILVRDATITIANQAHVEADLRGRRVLVRGTVRGAVSAGERIELAHTADVRGSLSANRIVISDGASFSGRVDMDQRTIAAKIARFKAARSVQ